MRSIRYFIALYLFLILPSGLIFWLVIHPLVQFWRKLGPGWTYSLAGGLMAVIMLGLYRVRDPLLATEFGTSYPLIGLAMFCLVGAGMISLKRRKHLTFRILAGLPELAPARQPSRLLTEGVYAIIRNPRYVEKALAVLAFALVANYLATYILLVLSIPVVYLIVILEEKELRERFSDAYDEYCRRVPRFVPKLGRRARRSVSAGD